jgi:hypothetical protein
MSIAYLRNRAKELRHTHSEAEYEEMLEKISRYLNITQDGQRYTATHKQKVLNTLRQLGIKTHRITQQ